MSPKAAIPDYEETVEEEAERETTPDLEPIAIPAVGEIVIMHSPHVGVDCDVQYRGKIGDEATVILDGYQMSIPMAWLRRRQIPDAVQL